MRVCAHLRVCVCVCALPSSQLVIPVELSHSGCMLLVLFSFGLLFCFPASILYGLVHSEGNVESVPSQDASGCFLLRQPQGGTIMSSFPLIVLIDCLPAGREDDCLACLVLPAACRPGWRTLSYQVLLP